MTPDALLRRCDNQLYQVASVPDEVNALRQPLTGDGQLIRLMTALAQEGGMITVCHGDPRLDNFYFGEDGGIGLLDWQLAAKAPIATDVSWVLCFHDLPRRFPDQVDGLVEGYFAKLQALGGAPGRTLADLREQVRPNDRPRTLKFVEASLLS